MLEKFEVSVKESEIAKLATLRTEWAEYKQKLHEANTRLQKAKADFKDDLLQSLTDFNNHTQAVRSEFLRAGPFDAEPTVAKAKEIMADYTKQVAAIRTKEADMKAGLDIFNIEPPLNAETSNTEKNLELLGTIWEMMEEWLANMEEWKGGTFATMDTNAIENTAAAFMKRLTKLFKMFEKGNPPWKVLDNIKDRVEGIKKLMPLIMDLRNEAMRDRHWKQLMEEVGET